MKQIAKASKGGQGLTQRQFTDAALQIAAIGHRALEARKMPVVLRTGNAKPDTFSRLAALAVMQATYRTVRPAAAIARRLSATVRRSGSITIQIRKRMARSHATGRDWGSFRECVDARMA
jgi:hypothetical protein